MIEIRNLSKTYRPKRGVPVLAIDRVSLSLPARGMVFLLGRSGSGKSTLLHLLGGLDRYEAGDILIKGRSTRGFSQSELDSYRNTYVGFVFQEYNLLDELTVGANVALAIELQGCRAEDHEVNAILEEVDLAGYGARRPNELSGGQKQRVAIARALVKKPKIIMADEPSAALDEQTGRSVFETLKKLSRERLVIVVSHDREFAETYADRIIELVDGRVADDRSVVATEETAAPTASALRYTDTAIEIPAGYSLTEEDRVAINAYLAARADGGQILPLGENSSARSFAPTLPLEKKKENEEKEEAERVGEAPTFIRSRLPLKTAFRIGASALGHKRIRLFFTVLLSVTAFILFGLTATMFSYDHVRTASKSLMDSDIRYASFRPVTVEDGYIVDYHWFREEDFKEALDATGLPLSGVFTPGTGLDFSLHFDASAEEYQAYGEELLTSAFSGFAEIGDMHLREYGYTLIAGRLPNGAADEIMISDYVLETFLRGGYRATPEEPASPIADPADILGKALILDDTSYTVVGVYDTAFDFSRYALLTRDPEELRDEDMVSYFVMLQECSYEKEYSLATPACVGEGFLDRYISSHPPRPNFNDNHWIWQEGNIETGSLNVWVSHVSVYPSSVPQENILWVNGEKSTLAPGEIILSSKSLDVFDAEGNLIEDPATVLSYLQKNGTVIASTWHGGADSQGKTFTIVGYIPEVENNDAEKTDIRPMYCAEADLDFFAIDPGKYTYAVAPMPRDRAAIEKLVRLAEPADPDALCLEMVNGVMFELNTLHELLLILQDLFLYMGIFFAIFAALLFSNFIGTSIVYKKREIGILRAIGSRARDVFCIFFAESFIIAVTAFLLSAIGTGLLSLGFNTLLREGTGLLISLLDFGIVQIALLFVISLALAVIASFFPVWRIASRRPIDAIRDR